MISASCAAVGANTNQELSTFFTISLRLYKGCVCGGGVTKRERERLYQERNVYSTHTQKLCNQKLDILALKISTNANLKFQFPPNGSTPPVFPLLQILLPKFPICFYTQTTSSLFIILFPANFALRVSRSFSSRREFWGQVLALLPPTTMICYRQKRESDQKNCCGPFQL